MIAGALADWTGSVITLPAAGCDAWRRREFDVRIGRHAGLQLVIGIVDVDLDAVDERDALGVGLHALGRELGIGRDERDAPVILLAGIGVGGDGCILAPVNLAEVGFGDVGAQPDVIEVGEGDDGRAGRDHFAEFGLAHGDDAGRGSTQRCVARVDARQAEAGVGLGEIGACNGDVFFAAAFLGLVVAAARAAAKFASERLRAVAARSRSCAEISSLLKSCCARSLSAFFCARSACASSNCLMRCLDLLLASAGQGERKIGFAHGHAGLVDFDLLLEVGIFKPRQQMHPARPAGPLRRAARRCGPAP